MREIAVGYDDGYPTCAETWATLRVYTGEVPPEEVTGALGLAPTSIHRVGEPRAGRRRAVNGWFLGSRHRVTSRDSRRHIDWLLAEILPRRPALCGLIDRGFRIDICCFWSSSQGHGGPTLSRPQLLGLAELGIDLWYDIYDASPEEEG